MICSYENNKRKQKAVINLTAFLCVIVLRILIITIFFMTRPKCECGRNLKPSRFDAKGNRRYYKFCSPCLISRTYKKRKTPPKDRTHLTKWLRQFKEDSCSMCGFVPEHLCQLDIDHIDGSRHNNDINNYQTLCANCHRLKTYKNKDWETKKATK